MSFFTIGSQRLLPDAIKKRKDVLKVKFCAVASYAKNWAHAITLISM